MVKLFVFVTLVAMSLTVEGFLPISGRGIFRGDPFPDQKMETPIPSNIVLETIEQRLDNFDPLNEATWEQYYYSNNEFYRPGGPIFLFLAGEWDITPYRLTYSLMADLADDLDGNIFYLEHRFYGQSRPTNDTSNENLRFLTVEQALADAAHFITFITSEEVTPGASDSPVIVIGGHYSGSLAVWLRQKYPHLVTGAWASSAPLQSLVNHVAYKEIAGAAYRVAGGNACYDALDDGFDEMEEYIADDRNSEIEEIFRACHPIVTDADEAVFFSIISELFAIIPQFNHIYSLAGVCDLITNGTAESDLHRIARHVDALIDDYFGFPCVPSSYDAFIEGDRETEWDHPANDLGIRPYTYQLCSQLGWYHSSDSEFQPFGSSFDDNLRYNACRDVFGEGFSRETIDANVARFNTVFGGLNPAVTNTLFVHGELDPYRSLGVQTNLNPSSQAIVIRGASQGNDLAPITDDDSAQLVAAKRIVIETITQWVQDA